MTTHDAGAGGPSGLEDSLPGSRQAAEPELDDYGLPVEQRRPTGRTDLLALAALICGVASIVLAGMDDAAHGKLAGYQMALGILSSSLAMLLALIVIFREASNERTKGVTMTLSGTGSVLGMCAFILLTSLTWHWGGGGAGAA